MGLQDPSEVQALAQCHYSAGHGTTDKGHTVTTVQGVRLQDPSEAQALAQCHHKDWHGRNQLAWKMVVKMQVEVCR